MTWATARNSSGVERKKIIVEVMQCAASSFTWLAMPLGWRCYKLSNLYWLSTNAWSPYSSATSQYLILLPSWVGCGNLGQFILNAQTKYTHTYSICANTSIQLPPIYFCMHMLQSHQYTHNHKSLPFIIYLLNPHLVEAEGLHCSKLSIFKLDILVMS